MESARKLKIGLVFDDTLDSSDGVAQYVKTLGSWLSSQGHEVRYLVGETKLTEWSGGRVYSLAKNYKVTFNGNKLSIPGLASRRRIKQVLDIEKFDVLHVQAPYSPLLAARIVNLAPKTTAIVGTFHIFPAGWLSRVGSWLLRLALLRSLRRFSQVVSVSPAAASFAQAAFGLKTTVVPNAVDVAKFRMPATTQKNIVFLGRLVDRKGCLSLLKAFNLVQAKMPGQRLTIAGVGPQRRSLENYVRDNDLSARVEFLGFVEEPRKAELLAGAKLACFPSLYGESFGIVLIEAMAAGARVVLGGNNPGYASVLGEQPQLLIDPRQTAEFAQRLELLLSDDTLASQLHEWQNKAVGCYDVNQVAKR